jgi:hypothetical protein
VAAGTTGETPKVNLRAQELKVSTINNEKIVAKIEREFLRVKFMVIEIILSSIDTEVCF